MNVNRLQVEDPFTEVVAATFPTMREVTGFLGDAHGFAFAAEEGGAAVGFAYGHLLDRPDGRRAVLLYEVEVDPAHRRRGIATALVAAVLQHGALSDAFEVWVLADPENAA
ncbi:MAG: GNAT family N-acetyltransferase, partial [Actinobacteria bacterium]